MCNQLVIFKGYGLCGECGKLFQLSDGSYCVVQEGTVICDQCFNEKHKDKADVLVFGNA